MKNIDPCRILRTWKLLCVVYVVVTFTFLLVSLADKETLGKHSDTRFNPEEPSADRFETSHRVNDNAKGQHCDMGTYLKIHTDICTPLINQVRGETPPESPETTQTRREFNRSIFEALKSGEHASINTNCNLGAVEQDCDAVKQSYLYGKYDITDTEKLFPLAFALKIHTSANQAHRLLRFIYRQQNVYCIHVDKKAPTQIYEKFKHIAGCLDNVILIDNRVSVIYSTIRQVEAELTCMKAVLKSKVSWKYYINLTGQEFVLKTNQEIVQILKLLNGTNDIESYPLPDADMNRVETKTILVKNWAVRVSERKAPFGKNVNLRKGSAYGLFSREFVNFITKDELVKEFIGWLQDTYAPEETIWATLNALPNVPGGYLGDITHKEGNFVSRAVKWSNSGSEMCHGKVVRHVCVYGIGDLPWLLYNRGVVANKFYEHVQPLTLTCLEYEMYRVMMSNGKTLGFDINKYKTLAQRGFESSKGIH